MFRLRLPEKQAGLSAGLGGFGWCERRIEVRFVWTRRMFGAGLARVWRGLGWCERRSARKENETWFPAPLLGSQERLEAHTLYIYFFDIRVYIYMYI